MSKRLVALPVAMLAIAVFAPGIANATTFNTTLSISISGAGNSFTGSVGSTHSACKGNRAVTLQRKSVGGTQFVNIGTDQSATNGKWTVNTNVVAGAQYRAGVSAKSLGGGDSCNAAASNKTLTARNTNTTIAIGASGTVFKGTVTSTSSCTSARKVTLQRKLSGGTSFSNVGTATTATNGTWSIATSPVNNAQYRAFVAGKTVGTDACMAKTSSTTTARNSVVSIVQGGSTNFHGTVTSLAACVPSRTVTLQRKTIYESLFHNLSSDATDAGGVWQVNTSVISGASYRASVSARQVGSNSCLNDLSPVVVAS
jgi:hypothetical protein